MADEIKLKAPMVEQQVVVNISGEDKLEKFADTLDKISKGRGLQKYWKDQQTLINDTIKAYNNFNKSTSQTDATELIKTTNALKAMVDVDISTLIPDFDKFTSALSKAESMAGHLTDAFTEKAFKDAFSSFEILKAYGLDLENFFQHFDLDINVANLQESLKLAEKETKRVRKELYETQEELSSKKIELASFIDGSGLTEQIEKLRYLEDEIRYVREQAVEEFKTFLKGNDFSGWDLDEYGAFERYFNEIRDGSLTAKEAIANFKSEYSYLLQEKFNESGGLFNLQQVQAFENKLETVLSRVEEISRQMNDIVENGVITKAMQNLSVDNSINQSQRDLFANVLKDEEALSSIAGVLKKIIDESINLQNTNSNTFNEEQFNKLLILFEKIESSLSSMRTIFVDVGDGEEFSPLLKMIDNVQSSIKELSTSVSGIKLDINMDLGSEVNERLNQRVSQSMNRQLEAYRSLFTAMKSTGKTNKEMLRFFEPDESSISEIIGSYKGVIKRAEEQFGKDVYKNRIGKDTYSAYVKEIKNATDQFNRATNKKNSENPLGDLFGKTDLTEVVSQLNLIVEKLGEISTATTEFKNAFKDGFNVSASVEEIEKLTNKVKELEGELSKIKVSPPPPVETNNSSSIKDTFQGEKIEQATTSAKELDKTLEQAVDVPTDKFDEILSKLDLTESKLGKIARITKQMHIDENGKPVESYTLKDKYGSTEIYGESSNKATKQLLSANYVEYDSKQAEKEAKELLAVEKEITKEIEKQEKAQASAQKKKWQAFENEQKKYVSDQKKTTDIEKNKSAYQELLDTIKQYSEVSKRIAKNETLDGDLELAQKLENKISELQKNPILSSSQIAKSERDLVNLFNQLDTLEKKTTKKQSDKSSAQSAKEQAEAWDKNVKAIQEYMDANTKLNNLKAQDKGTGKKSSEIVYQTKEVERLEKVALEARAALSSMINPHEAPIDDWNKWLEVMKQFDQATEGSARSVVRLKDALRNMAESQSKKVASTLLNSENYLATLKPSEGNRSVGFEKTVQEYEKAVNALKEFQLTLNATTPLTKEQSIKFEELTNDVKSARIEIEKIPKALRGSDEDSRMKEIDKLTKYLDENTKISKKAKQQLQDYLALLKSGNPSVSVKEIHTAWTKVAVAEREAHREGKRFFDIFSNKMLYGYATQLANYYLSFMDIIRYLKYGIDTIRELDTALTEMRKVSDETVSSLERFQDESFDLANNVGTTGKQLQDSTADWMRLGEAMDDASESAKVSNILLNVSEFENIDEATESLVAMSQAYKDLEKIEIVDTLNKIGNEYSIATDGIATALQDSASALVTANNDLSQATALITAGNAVVQDPSKVGAGIRTIALRLVGTKEAKEELEELGEEVDDMVMTSSKVRETIMNATKAANGGEGFDIFDENGNYKSTYEIMQGLADLYDDIVAKDKEMGTNNLNLLLETIAGKNRSNIAASILQNGDMLRSVYDDAQNADGSAQEELDKYLESIDGRMAKLENQAQEFWHKAIDSDVIKGGISLLTDLLGLATDFVDTIGLLPTAGIGLGAYLGFKNVGRPKMFGLCFEYADNYECSLGY